MISSPPLITEDGLDYYIIPESTLLYRGDTPAYTYYVNDDQKFIFNPGFYFFGTNEDHVEQYGIVFEFQTIKSYKLLALDSKDSLEKLKAKIYDTKICHILDKNYGTTTGIRYSESEKDKQLCYFLCVNGYEGYAILKDRSTSFSGIFHHEVMICNPQSGIECVSVVTSEEDIQRLLDDYRLRQAAAPSKKQKVKSLAVSPPRRPLFSDSSPTGSLIGDSSPTGSLIGPGRSLFGNSPLRGSLLGGSKHKTNRKSINNRKKHKSRKIRKP